MNAITVVCSSGLSVSEVVELLKFDYAPYKKFDYALKKKLLRIAQGGGRRPLVHAVRAALDGSSPHLSDRTQVLTDELPIQVRFDVEWLLLLDTLELEVNNVLSASLTH